MDRAYRCVAISAFTAHLNTANAGPNGVKYYFNASTQESTYVRPLPPPPSNTAKPKKEKPSTKTPIPGTDWLRVKTNEGNTFYFHPVDKTSLWTVPPEIKEAVDAFEQEEKRVYDDPAEREVQRVKAEVETLVKRKADDGNAPNSRVSKKAKVQAKEESESSDDDGPEEDWEKEAAEQLAAEAKKAEEEAAARKIQQKVEEELAKRQKADLKIPDRVDLSIDEAKALFKVCNASTRLGISIFIYSDPTSGKGHKSSSSLGLMSPPFRIRPSLCSSGLRSRSTGCFRRVLS